MLTRGRELKVNLGSVNNMNDFPLITTPDSALMSRHSGHRRMISVGCFKNDNALRFRRTQL